MARRKMAPQAQGETQAQEQAVPEVLIAAGCPHVTVTRYRCLHLREQLAANGVTAAVAEWYDPACVDPHQLLPEKALVLQRVAYTPALGTLIERMQAAGRAVIFDVDDLVFEPQLAAAHRGAASLPAAERALYLEGVTRYQAVLAACDHVLTASPLLAALAARHGVKAHVHRNALGEEMLGWATELYGLRRGREQARAADGAGRLVLGYGSGTPTHDVDFAAAAPGVLDILTGNPHAELWIAGPMRLPQELEIFAARVRRFPLLDWRSWFALLAQVDINLAPLEMGNVFCRAKSEIKFVEAAALGIPTVASQIDPFVDAIAPGETGLLAANPADWMDHLRALAADGARRRRMGEASRAAVLARYSPAARAADLAQLLPEILQRNTEIRMDTHRSMSGATAGADSAGFVPLTIHWLVSEPIGGSGGHLGIFRMIRHLVDFGHTCHVHMIPVNFMHGYTPAQMQRHVDEHFLPTGAIYHQWEGRIGPADATVATFWRTVPPLLKLPLPGRRYYLVQDFEPFFYPMGLEYIEAENSYRQGLHCLTLGPWLSRLLRERYGAAADPFDFAVDAAVYHPPAGARLAGPQAHPRVAFYARPSTPRRAYELGVAALELVKRQMPQVEIIFFGAETLPPLPFPVTNAGQLNPWELAGLFGSCDVGVVFSTTNPSFVPFEMMACRCAVVDLASERVEGLLEDGANCRLVAPEPAGVAAAVLDLIRDPQGRAEIVGRAYAGVQGKSWEQSARQIEALLLRHTPPATRVAAQAASGDDLDVLAWQIHQLLDAGDDNAALVEALRSALYRTLAEKAVLVAHVQAVEARLGEQGSAGAWGATTLGDAAASGGSMAGGRAGTALAPLATRVLDGVLDGVLDSAGAWRLGNAALDRLPLGDEPLRQWFTADRSHLRRIELRLAPTGLVHTGSLCISICACGEEAGEGAGKDRGGRLVAGELVRVAELPLGAPLAVEFPPQADSYGRCYLLTVAPGELHRLPPALWHFRTVQHTGAKLCRGDEELAGQLVFQPFYGERGALLGSRQGPVGWDEPIRFVPALAQAAVSRQAQEARRLGGQVRQALQARGVRGLLQEIKNYVKWQISKP